MPGVREYDAGRCSLNCSHGCYQVIPLPLGCSDAVNSPRPVYTGDQVLLLRGEVSVDWWDGLHGARVRRTHCTLGWVLNDGCENSWQHVLSVAFELATLAGMLVELIRV